MDFTNYKLEIFLPEEAFHDICAALRDADAGHIGNYDACLSWSHVHSRWRPMAGTHPYLGTPGALVNADEIKIEVACRADKLEETLKAVCDAHPYEEPVINVMPLYATGLIKGKTF